MLRKDGHEDGHRHQDHASNIGFLGVVSFLIDTSYEQTDKVRSGLAHPVQYRDNPLYHVSFCHLMIY